LRELLPDSHTRFATWFELAQFNGAIPLSGDSRTSRTGHHLTGEVVFARMWRRAEVAQL